MNRFFIIATLVLLVLTGCAAPQETQDTLTVGLECNYAPFNWTQVQDTDTALPIGGDSASFCDGYDVSIAQHIADELELTLVVKKIAWEGLIVSLNEGDIDMIVAGMTDTEERRQEVAFSDPYYNSDLVLIVRNDSAYASATSLADFAGANVIAQKSTFHDTVIEQIAGVVHGTPLDSFPLLANSVLMSDADAMVSEFPVAKSIVASNPDLTIVQFAAGSGFATDPLDTTVSVALRQEDTELLAQINEILAAIDQDTRNAWMVAAGERQPE